VGVRYDPRDPERNDLVEKETRSRLILWAVGVGLVVVWVLVLALGRSR